MSTLHAIEDKILTASQLKMRIAQWRAKGYSVAFTNGCFDIVHKGHVNYLSQAADQATFLVVGLNSDASVKRLKGEDRPVNDESARAYVLAGLHAVDAVCVFEEDTPLHMIEWVKPDVLIKGGDYDVNETDPSSKSYIVGSKEVKANGGKVVTIPFVDGFSTSGILKKISD